MFTEAKSGRLITTNFSKNHWHCLQLLQQPIYLGVGYESNFVISAMFPMISNVDKLTGSKKNISNILVPSEVLFPGITWITWKYKTHIFVLFFLGGFMMVYAWCVACFSTPDLRVTEKTLHVQVIIDLQGGGFCGNEIATSWCTLLSSLWQLWSPSDSYMVHGRYN